MGQGHSSGVFKMGSRVAAGVTELAAPPQGRPEQRGASKAAEHPTVRRIVHIAKHCSYGNGNVHVAVDLACVQADHGCEVLFLSSGGTFVPMLERHGVRHIALEQDTKSPWLLAKSLRTMMRTARAFRPEVLHAHMMGAAVLAWICGRVVGVPVVTTVHNSFDRHAWIMRLGTKIVAVSEAERQSLLRQGYPADRLEVVMNAPLNSPREEFMPPAQDFNIKSPYILTVCGLHKRKGVADLIQACAAVFPSMPGWRLCVAGEGPDRELLERLAERCAIRNRVHFLGFVANPREVMRKSEIFALCSYADPCSLVIGEARGAGCAIVASAVGGTPEMLDFGLAGRLFKAGDVDRLASELHYLMLHSAQRDRLRIQAYAGSEVFHVSRLLHDYDSVYRSAICTRRSGPRSSGKLAVPTEC